ncbi:MAG: hypothetical protein JWP31_1985 [Aeromicrobium sp.]|nr:hypothetical protein [Aeromicrobium sp.]
MKKNMKDMPAEFFLPPQTDEGLRKETMKLVALSAGFIVALGAVVALTQDIVIRLG